MASSLAHQLGALVLVLAEVRQPGPDLRHEARGVLHQGWCKAMDQAVDHLLGCIHSPLSTSAGEAVELAGDQQLDGLHTLCRGDALSIIGEAREEGLGQVVLAILPHAGLDPGIGHLPALVHGGQALLVLLQDGLHTCLLN